MMFDQFSTCARRRCTGFGGGAAAPNVSAEPYLRDAQLVLAPTQDNAEQSGKTTTLSGQKIALKPRPCNRFMTMAGRADGSSSLNHNRQGFSSHTHALFPP